MSSGATGALLLAVFGGTTHPLAAWYAGLLEATPPLRAFTAAYAPKIHKKARLATTPDARRDLRCELALAAVLAADRRSALAYEPLAAAGRRGPDFLLRHKGHTNVYVEVSRLRPAHAPARDPTERLATVLCGKLGQLAAGAANLLVLISDDGPFQAEAIGTTVRSLRRRADTKDDAFFVARGMDGARTLHQTLPRLGGVLAVAPGTLGAALFLHPQAGHPLPADLVRAAATWQLNASIGPLADEARPEAP